jgi:protein-glutamine gamma-glutamyltransferase
VSRPMSTASLRLQLNLDELRRLKWLLGGALALVSLWTVFFLDVEAVGLVALASAVVLTAIIWPQVPARVPTIVWRLAVPGIIAAVAADFYLSPDTLPVLIRLAVLLVLYRAVAYRRKREDLQLLVLGLFLMVAAGVLTVSLGFAFLLLLFTACALGFLFVVTLIDMVDTGPRVMRPEEMREIPGWARGGWSRPLQRYAAVADWRLLGFAAVLFAGVVGVSALLFLIIPRFEIGSSFFLDRYITRKSRTGFTEQVRFGSVAELVRDQSVAMRVDLSDAASLPELPYFRLLVLDEYTPQGFRLSNGMKNDLLRGQRIAQFMRERRPTLEPVGGEWTFYVEPGVSRFLPLPGAFTTLRLREPAPLQVHAGARLVSLRSEPVSMTAFQIDGVELEPELRDVAFQRVLAEQRERRLRPNDPGRHLLLTTVGPDGFDNEAALARMVREISGGEELEARKFGQRATVWIQQRHRYALSANVPRGTGDDIVRWLVSNEPGFCEFFAGGLAVLSRAAGHPARVVAGFRGGTLNAFENYIMVRNSDAHAWVEIFDGESWFKIDPTPGGDVLPGQSAHQLARREEDSSWRARMDTLRVFWYRRIVSFDSRQQVELVDSVKTFTTSFGEALRNALNARAQQIKAWLSGPWDFARMGRVLGVIALAAALAWTLSRAWAWGRLHWRTSGGMDAVRREAGRWLARGNRHHGGKHTGVKEWAETHAQLQRLRFGRRDTWPEPRSVFKRARRLLRR